jgi:hypothetical protein
LKSLKRFLFYIVCFASTLSGCKQDIAITSWDVDVLAPVIHTRLTMADLVADSLLTSSADGALRLNIETSLIDLPLDSILQIPDTTLSKDIVSPVVFTDVAPGFEVPGSVVDETQYDLGDLALKKVTVRSGKLKLKIKSIIETSLDFTYRIPVASLYGNQFVSSGVVPPGSVSDTAIAEFEFDLANYNIDLRGLDGSGFNKLVTAFNLNTSLDGDTVTIPSGTILRLEYSFLDIVPNYGVGYFGQQSTSSEEENSKIDVLDRITDGQMFLDSVTIGLHIVNGVGADAKFKLDRLASVNTRTGNTVELNHEIVGSNILLTRALDITGNAADVIPYTVNYELNNANSNIKQFIENLPNELGFTFGFDLNPLGNVSAGNDFFYYDRPFEALMNIDIPLRTRIDNLTLVDTIAWNLSESGVVESVNSGSFTLIAVNGLPLSGSVELIMLDENMVQLDTLVAPSTIAAPQLDSDNRVLAPLESRINIPVPARVTAVLPETRHVRIKATFNTAGQPDLMEFYDTYGIDLKLIGNFNINFGPSTF